MFTSIVGWWGGHETVCHAQCSFQVLPVLCLHSGISVVLCCSQSCPSSSHWPWTGSFSSSLDGRSSSPPSESYTQRCLCQPKSRTLEEGTMVRSESAYSHITTKHYTSGCIFPQIHSSFSSFSSVTHWTKMQ